MELSNRERRRQSLFLLISLLFMMPPHGVGQRQRCRSSPAFQVRSDPASTQQGYRCRSHKPHGVVTPCGRTSAKERRGSSIWETRGIRAGLTNVVLEDREEVEDRKKRGRRRSMPSRVAAVSPSSSSPSSTRASGVPGSDGSTERTAGDGSGGGKYHLMLVDDEEALRRAVSEYLEQRGYSVAAHASAGEALQSLSRDQNASPDLIITDVNMPEMNGFRFLEALRAGGRRERSIPVVFLTARGMTTDRIEGYRAGVNAYLSKPFDPEELVSIVDNVIVNHTKTAQEAAAEAAEAAKKEAAIDAAQLVSVGRGAGEEGASSSAGAGDLGGSSSEVLEDVRRELGDIKALLLADRAHRRNSSGGSIVSTGGVSGRGRLDNRTINRGPRLLTTSNSPSSSRHEPADPAARSLGSPLREASARAGPPGGGWAEDFIADAIDTPLLPPVVLSGRERTVLLMVLEGHTNREIAQVLGLSVRSVEKHVSSMLAKTGTSNRTELVRYSLRENLVPEGDP